MDKPGANMVLVPREPTPEMIEAGRWPAEDDGPAACYKAMLSAAPQPSLEGEVGQMVERLRKRYTAEPVPPCSVCGLPMSIQSAGGGNATVYGCEAHRPFDWKHYEQSRWTQYRPGDEDVLAAAALLQSLSADNTRLREVLEKTIAGANILLADSRQCSIQHHHVTWFDERPPGWWADIQNDVLAARQFLDTQGGGNG